MAKFRAAEAAASTTAVPALDAPKAPKKAKVSKAMNGKVSKSETPRDKFLRLIDKRMEAALSKITLVANLARPSYEFTQDEAHMVVTHLDQAVGEVKAAFDVRLKGKRRFSIKKR